MKILAVFKKIILWFIIIISSLIIIGLNIESYNRSIDDRNTIVDGNLIDIGGRNLFCNCQGNGEPVIWLESGGQGWSKSWVRVQEALSSTTTVCAYDRAGLGFSDPLKKPQTGAEMVKDLHDLNRKLHNGRPFILVGHSLGGLLARIYHQTYPDEVNALFLIEPGYPKEVIKMMNEAPEIKPFYFELTEFAANTGLIRWFYKDKLQDPKYPQEFVSDFKARFSRAEVASALTKTIYALKGIAEQTNENPQFGATPVRVVYTSNFSEVGTSFENSQEKEDFERAYLDHWKDLASRSADNHPPIVIDGANHITVTLYPEFTAQISEHIGDLVQQLRTERQIDNSN